MICTKAPSIHLSPLVSCCQLAPSHLPPSTPLPLLPAYACWHQVTQVSPPGVPLLLPTTHCSSITINTIPYPFLAPPLHFTLLPPALCTSHECKHLLKERELSDKQEEIALTAKRIERDQDAPKDKRGVNTQLDILEDAGRSMERATECLSSSKVLAIKPGADKNKLSSDDLVGVPFEDTGDGTEILRLIEKVSEGRQDLVFLD